MKMSDVFTEEVKTERAFPELGKEYEKFRTLLLKDEKAAAAAHAINQHDQLTAINQELVEALEIAKRSLATYGEHPIVEGKMNNAIKRAKELTNEG